MQNWIKISALTFLCLSPALWSQDKMDYHEKSEKFFISDFKENEKTLEKYTFAIWFGLQSKANFETYHLAHKFFNPSHQIPTKKDILKEIYSHPCFKGVIAKDVDEVGIKKNLSKLESSFVIYEALNQGKNHFYFVHPKGIRHFRVNKSDKNGEMEAWLDNATVEYYPSLKQFIRCTLS